MTFSLFFLTLFFTEPYVLCYNDETRALEAGIANYIASLPFDIQTYFDFIGDF